MGLKVSKIAHSPFFIWSVLLLAGFIYLTIGIGHETLWFDEAYSASIINHSFMDIVDITTADSHPPLYYIMLKTSSFIFGRTETGLRILSVFGALALAALGAGPIRKIFGTATGIIFALVVMTAPMVLSMAQETRMYTWSAFFVTGAILYGYLAAIKGKKSNWLLFSLFTLASAYTHYYSLLAVAIANLIIFVWLIINDRNKLKHYITSAIGCLICFLPWVGAFLGQASTTAKKFWIPKVTLDVVWQALLLPYRAKFDVINPIAVISFTVASALIVWGLIVSFRTTDKKSFLPAFAIIVYAGTILSGILISLTVKPLFIERYAFPLIGLFLLAASYGISAFNNKKISILFLVAFTLISTPQSYRIITHNFNGPAKEINSYIQKNLQPDDVFLHTSEHSFGIFLYYFPDNKHLLLEEIISLRPKGYEAFAPNGSLVSDIESGVKDYKNIWVFDQLNAWSSEAFGWYGSGLLVSKENAVRFTAPDSPFGFLIRQTKPGDKKDKVIIPEGEGTIRLTVTGITDKEGSIVVRLFNKPGLLFKQNGDFSDELVVTTKSVAAKEPEVEVAFDNVPFGYYAAIVLHDENGNNQLDYTGFFIPDEGIGMTNGFGKNGGIPGFEDGKFLLDKEEFEAHINISYDQE